MFMKKNATSYRISTEAKTLIEQLAKKLGVSQTAILELAIREYSERQNRKQSNAD